MKLYGSVQKSNYTFGKWYLELPEIWSRDRDFILSYPYPHLLDLGKQSLHKDLFNFYEMEVGWMDFSRVFDLRCDDWRDKLLTFVKFFGYGWASKGNIIEDGSPLDHLTYLGNYNILASKNYLWSAINHGPFNSEDFVEIWYYVNTFEHPDNYYTLSKIDPEEL